MNVHELRRKLLREAQKEEKKYVPAMVPKSLYERLVHIKEAEGLSMSSTMVLAARLLVQSYDGADSPQGNRGEVAEGGDGSGR